MNKEHIPLLSPKPFAEYSGEEYLSYIKSMYREPVNKEGKVVRDVSFRINDKGTHIITVRNRKPKWIAKEEINILATEAGIPQNVMWQTVGRKKIPVGKPEETK